MKITKSQLKQLVKEEIEALKEAYRKRSTYSGMSGRYGFDTFHNDPDRMRQRLSDIFNDIDERLTALESPGGPEVEEL